MRDYWKFWQKLKTMGLISFIKGIFSTTEYGSGIPPVTKLQKKDKRKTSTSGKKKRFYFLLPKDNKRNGVAYAPQGTDTQWGRDVDDVIGYESMVFELRRGCYTPYLCTNICAELICGELKDLVEQYLPDNYPLEFLPIKITSKDYGDKVYYLPHFKIIFDVINVEASKKEDDIITVPCIDYEKSKELDFFNSIAYSDGYVVSDKIKREMKKKNLDFGIEFWEWKAV